MKRSLFVVWVCCLDFIVLSFFFIFGFSRTNVIMKWVVWVGCLDFIVLLLSFSFLVSHGLMWSWNELCESVVWISLSFFFFFGYSLPNVIMKWVVWVCCLDFIVLLLSFSFLVTHDLMWSWNELCESVVWISLFFFFLFLFWWLTL